GRSWDKIIAAIDEIITTPDVDATLAAKAAKELAEPAPPDEDDLADDGALEAADDAEREEPAQRAAGDTVVLGDDDDFWAKVGIDPIRVMTSGGTFYTLRCYFDDRPIFLGRNGRVSVFGSER